MNFSTTQDSSRESMLLVDSHDLALQIGSLVEKAGESYQTPLRKQSYESEYECRTAVMQETKMERLSALLRPSYSPLDETDVGRRYL